MSRRVLVVDDEADIRAVARLSLSRVGGWEVLVAGSSAEALEVAARERPDAVVLDVMMPGTDGPTTFARMQDREDLRDLPVVLLTARVDRAERETWLALGVRGVLGKPFDPLTLPAELSAALGWAP